MVKTYQLLLKTLLRGQKGVSTEYTVHILIEVI